MQQSIAEMRLAALLWKMIKIPISVEMQWSEESTAGVIWTSYLKQPLPHNLLRLVRDVST